MRRVDERDYCEEGVIGSSVREGKLVIVRGGA